MSAAPSTWVNIDGDWFMFGDAAKNTLADEGSDP